MSQRRRRPMARSSARRLGAAATALVVCVGVASVARAGEGSPPSRVDLRSGSAWVGSSVGLMTLIDGDSGEVVARVDIGAPSGSLVTTQYGSVGYAVNGESGAVVRVDPRTLVPSSPVQVLERASGHVSARAAGPRAPRRPPPRRTPVRTRRRRRHRYPAIRAAPTPPRQRSTTPGPRSPANRRPTRSRPRPRPPRRAAAGRPARRARTTRCRPPTAASRRRRSRRRRSRRRRTAAQPPPQEPPPQEPPAAAPAAAAPARHPGAPAHGQGRTLRPGL